jgi:hypothetical protein
MSLATATRNRPQEESTTAVNRLDQLDGPVRPEGGWASSALQSPNLNRGSVFASSARAAARINATSISQAERQALLDERQALLDKLFGGDITSEDERKLEYVNWSLDRIEDAENGFALDALESQIEAYEHIANEISKYHGQLQNLAERKARR